jgi:hypothetical protein
MVRPEERLSRRLHIGDVHGLRLQQGHRLARRVLRHIHDVLLLVRRQSRRQRPRLLLRLPLADDGAPAAVDNSERFVDPLLLLGLHDCLCRHHEDRGVA